MEYDYKYEYEYELGLTCCDVSKEVLEYFKDNKLYYDIMEDKIYNEPFTEYNKHMKELEKILLKSIDYYNEEYIDSDIIHEIVYDIGLTDVLNRKKVKTKELEEKNKLIEEYHKLCKEIEKKQMEQRKLVTKYRDLKQWE